MFNRLKHLLSEIVEYSCAAVYVVIVFIVLVMILNMVVNTWLGFFS